MNQLLLLCSILLFGCAQAGELYRSIDSEGKVLYSDSPLADSDDVVLLKMSIEPSPDEGFPYETQMARKNFPVSLYVFPNCSSVCQQARDCLIQRGVPFTEVNLVTQSEIDEFRKDSGGIQIPALVVGKTWLKGYLAEQWNKELDFAGYPRSSSYRPRPATSTPLQSAP